MSSIVKNTINAIKMQCPRCRKGKIFKNALQISISKNNEMVINCSVCGQPTEIEVGFYYGTGYVSYALTVALSVATFLAWIVIIGAGDDLQKIPYWFISNAILLVLLQPWIMRLSRSLWLSWFVKYDRDWKSNPIKNTGRVIESQMEGKQDISNKKLD